MDRRKFLVAGSMIGSGLALGTYAATNRPAPSDSFNVGIIGTGNRGKGLIQLLKDIQGINITDLCDILPFRLSKASEILPNANTYDDYNRLLEKKDIDAIVVAVPFGLHYEVAYRALDAGKHVFCEKTMAKGFDEIKKLVDKVKSGDLIFQTGHQYHSSRLYKHIVQEVQGGMLGDIAAIQCQWNRNGDWRRKVPSPEYEKIINWRMYRELSGGLVAELCSHQIDFANWLLGETPSKVMGTGGINFWKDGRETFDNIHLITEYPNGVKATYMCTTTNRYGDYQIKILGKKGTIELGYDTAWFTPEEALSKQKGNVDGVSGATMNYLNKPGYAIKVEHKDPTLQALLDFKDCIVNNKEPESNVITGGNAATVVQMALNAMDNQVISRWKAEYSLQG